MSEPPAVLCHGDCCRRARAVYGDQPAAWHQGWAAALAALTPTWVATGPLVINLTDTQIFIAGQEVYFPPRELGLLTILAQHIGHPVSEPVISEAIWGPTEVAMIAQYHRGRNLTVMTCRLRDRLASYGVFDMIVTHQNNRARMLVDRPLVPFGDSEKGGPPIPEEIAVGYSRAEVRHLLTHTLTYLKEGRLTETESLLTAAINGLPDFTASMHSTLGRPNEDQRVLHALKTLAATPEKPVRVRDVARQVKRTVPATAKALHRAATRRPEIGHTVRTGWYLHPTQKERPHATPASDGTDH